MSARCVRAISLSRSMAVGVAAGRAVRVVVGEDAAVFFDVDTTCNGSLILRMSSIVQLSISQRRGKNGGKKRKEQLTPPSYGVELDAGVDNRAREERRLLSTQRDKKNYC